MADSRLSCISCCCLSWQNIFGLLRVSLGFSKRSEWIESLAVYWCLFNTSVDFLKLYCEDYEKVELRVKGQSLTLTWSTQLLLTAAWQAKRLGMKKWNVQGAVGKAVYGNWNWRSWQPFVRNWKGRLSVHFEAYLESCVIDCAFSFSVQNCIMKC